jgi:hypothetical protein
MVPRVIIGVVAVAGAAVCAVLSTTASFEMVNQVNERLVKEDQFAELGWHFPKTLRLHREYKRLYPSGRLLGRVYVLGGLMFFCLLICAWSFGFFS